MKKVVLDCGNEVQLIDHNKQNLLLEELVRSDTDSYPYSAEIDDECCGSAVYINNQYYCLNQEKLKPIYQEEGFVEEGFCMGVRRDEHRYNDGRLHYNNSHGLCKQCYNDLKLK